MPPVCSHMYLSADAELAAPGGDVLEGLDLSREAHRIARCQSHHIRLQRCSLGSAQAALGASFTKTALRQLGGFPQRASDGAIEVCAASLPRALTQYKVFTVSQQRGHSVPLHAHAHMPALLACVYAAAHMPADLNKVSLSCENSHVPD